MKSVLIVVLLLLIGGGLYVVSRSSGSGEGQEPGLNGASEAPPSWVSEPASYYDPVRDDVVLATGSAQGGANQALLRRQAEAMARASLLEALGTGEFETSVIQDPLDGSVTGIRRTANGAIRDSRVLQYWSSPEGEMHVLMEAPRDQSGG